MTAAERADAGLAVMSALSSCFLLVGQVEAVRQRGFEVRTIDGQVFEVWRDPGQVVKVGQVVEVTGRIVKEGCLMALRALLVELV